MFGWTFYDFEDFVGGDLSNQPATDRNYCQTMCQQVEGCNAYSWSSSQKVCYFKGGIQSSSRREKNKDIYSAILGGRNECVKKGVVYFDNRDFTGGDFKSVGAAGVDECAFACAFTPGCTAFGFAYNNCYMKKFTVDYPASKPNGNVQSGLLCNKLVTGRDVVRVDNPYAGASGYVSPDFAQSVDSSIARDGSIAGKANVVKNQPTAIWVDTIENLSKIGKHMRNAGRQASASNPVTIQFIVYNLPGRDCHALASNGQIAVGGIDTYKSQYIDRFVDELNRNNNPHVRIVLIIEPDSLPNLATNMDNPRCAAAGPGYKEGVAYALSKLTTIPNVYMYIDVAHGGWLGWEDGQESIVRILQDTFGWARAMNGNLRIQGFATNIANYSPVFSNGVPPAKQKAPMFMAKDKGGNERLTYDYNPAIDENLFLSILAWRFRQAGLPSRFIIDTSRNGVAGIRTRWGSWCNNKGAGIGFRPQANPITNVDAYVWAKPPGESDGASSGNSRVDGFCVAGGPDGFDALYNAPQAGEWFHDQFVELVRNANPPL
ncbi:1, 4-beta cellobiohydrolase [Globomyces pollinis-pini]|nr:1, 4-beta cellobiohydrolase [Globomyces pollinis-pini]